MMRSSWILKLVSAEWQKRPLTKAEAERLVMYLDHLDSAVAEASLAFGQMEGHARTFYRCTQAADGRADE